MIRSGLPRRAMIVSSSRATLLPEIEVSAIAARHSLVTSSITLRMRKRRVRLRLDQDRRPHARRPLATLALADGQAFLAVKPLRVLSRELGFGRTKSVWLGSRFGPRRC